jgi:hypothetical protein
VHDRESLARPDPEIWHVESGGVEETGLRNDSHNSDGFTCGHEHRASKSGFGANGRAAGSRTNTKISGRRDAARSRDGTAKRRNVSKEQVQIESTVQTESQAASASSFVQRRGTSI